MGPASDMAGWDTGCSAPSHVGSLPESRLLHPPSSPPMRNHLPLRLLPALALSVVALGCGVTAAPLRTAVEVEVDPYQAATIVRGVEQRAGDARYFLRSWIRGDTVTHQIYVRIYYSGSDWRFYERALAAGGASLDFVSIDRSVDGCVGSGICLHTEVFGLAVSGDMLGEAQAEGLQLRAYARSGAASDLEVTPTQISAQLAEIKVQRGRVAPQGRE